MQRVLLSRRDQRLLEDWVSDNWAEIGDMTATQASVTASKFMSTELGRRCPLSKHTMRTAAKAVGKEFPARPPFKGSNTMYSLAVVADGLLKVMRELGMAEDERLVSLASRCHHHGDSKD